jgi:glutamate/aspartate transport system substrate-binding protein
MHTLIQRALPALLTGCLTLGAHAQDLTGRLGDIKSSNTIVLGYRESSLPYSYYDNDQKVVGYSHDIDSEDRTER